jgi:hypothetical protein
VLPLLSLNKELIFDGRTVRLEYNYCNNIDDSICVLEFQSTRIEFIHIHLLLLFRSL